MASSHFSSLHRAPWGPNLAFLESTLGSCRSHERSTRPGLRRPQPGRARLCSPGFVLAQGLGEGRVPGSGEEGR